jgi:2-haloacid dehalogenase
MAAPLPQTPRLITFDTYGTLIDWDGALRSYVAELLSRHGHHGDVGLFYQRWYDNHALPAAVSAPFEIYRDLLARTMNAALGEIGVTADPGELSVLGDVMAEAKPFDETLEVLNTLKRHVPLGTISNSQADIMARSAELLEQPFTYVFTAEAVRAYKPAPALFELILERSGVPVQDTVHVAQSQFVDLPRSVPWGMPTVWINRQGQTLRPENPPPTAVLPDLRGLPDLLGLGGLVIEDRQ